MGERKAVGDVRSDAQQEYCRWARVDTLTPGMLQDMRMTLHIATDASSGTASLQRLTRHGPHALDASNYRWLLCKILLLLQFLFM